jgi:hypothetical protein
MRYKGMMDDEQIINISPLLTHTHTLPLYLAPLRLDPPHTHTHGEVKFTSTKRGGEGRRRQR